ncbi:MurR/RpiR family transcriptional regulator [Gynuella sunshinyii]|uniref:Transcriptional regulator n=1 Tax=Gynuella sunshinyii YC6258 TaxID=1445510 RepID=A0A0C5VJ52_9GAMM|nr:MurR/RpiR family transcriptional regulator [Gynuella sunshinyii]AJQ93428.1 transcriptional regulator [Gynuella sunshinyii YC6258]
MSLQRRIENSWQGLSPSERKIAVLLEQNQHIVVSHSVAEIATMAGVSKATVSRFFRSLGYDDHMAARLEMRSSRESGVPVQLTSITPPEALQEEWQNLVQAHKDFDHQESALADAILAAENIYILGFRNGYPAARHLRQQLVQLRPGVSLLPAAGQTLAEDMVDISSRDLVILMGFRRRIKSFKPLIQGLNRQLDQQQLVLLTDPTGSGYGQWVGTTVICPLGAQQPMDNYSVVFSLISRLVNTVAERAGSLKRIQQIKTLYEELDELDL